MAWTTREMVILGILVMCVPAQYWLVSRWADGTKPQHAVLKLGKELEKLSWIWFESLECWKRWYLQFVATLRKYISSNKTGDLNGECPAKEVILFREQTGYFGLSPNVRPHRPAYILHRVGQVIKIVDHKEQGAMGVIIAWDLYARAPESWLMEHYGNDLELRKEPHYRVLLSRPLLRETYVAQRHIKVLRATQINHPRVSEIFSHFDGAQYIPRLPLRQLYPLD